VVWIKEPELVMEFVHSILLFEWFKLINFFDLFRLLCAVFSSSLHVKVLHFRALLSFRRDNICILSNRRDRFFLLALPAASWSLSFLELLLRSVNK
jgi:hypothetical protein